MTTGAEEVQQTEIDDEVNTEDEVQEMSMTGEDEDYWNEEEDAEFIATFTPTVVDQIAEGSKL